MEVYIWIMSHSQNDIVRVYTDNGYIGLKYCFIDIKSQLLIVNAKKFTMYTLKTVDQIQKYIQQFKHPNRIE